MLDTGVAIAPLDRAGAHHVATFDKRIRRALRPAGLRLDDRLV